jgi:hypothetical protein
MIIEAIHAANLKRINPFQIFAAIKHCGNKNVAKALDSAFIRATENLPKLSGTTVALIDVSGSMTFDTVSKRSEMTRMEAAASLGAILREVCDKLRLIPFATAHGELVTKVRGGTLVQAIVEAGRRMGGGTNTGDAVHFANQMDYDRIIIVTDEQSHQRIEQPQGNGYIVNVGSYEPSIAYGDWTSITGWSENFITYISESEKD